jgi:hypothetical protein
MPPAVKSCITTRLGVNAISIDAGPVGSPLASASKCVGAEDLEHPTADLERVTGAERIRMRHRLALPPRRPAGIVWPALAE